MFLFWYPLHSSASISVQSWEMTWTNRKGRQKLHEHLYIYNICVSVCICGGYDIEDSV